MARKKHDAVAGLSRKEKRDLDIEIEFLEGVLRRDPDYLEVMQVLGDDYTRRGRHEDGLRIDERLASQLPDDPLAFYNLACSYSLLAQLELAARALERALDLGYRDFKWLAEDPDMDNLRADPIYRRIRAKLKSLQIKIH